MSTFSKLTGAAALLGALGAGSLALADDGRMGGFGPRAALDFAAIDSDGNGALSRGELEARGTAGLAAFDTNGDGALDRAEIIAAMPEPRGGMMTVFAPNHAEDHADRLLTLMGAKEAGRIEIAAMNTQQVDRLLERLDGDNDGAISKAEADAMADRRANRRGHGGGMDHEQF